MKQKGNKFDTFLCHNSKDKEEVHELLTDLLDTGILPWIDDEEILGGMDIVGSIDDAIRKIHSAIIFIGPFGRGPFQKKEYSALMMTEGKKIIPVISKECKKDPEIPPLLKAKRWIDLRNHSHDNIGELYKEITGENLSRPKVFVAEVGERLEEEYNALKSFLRQFGIIVLPEKTNLKKPDKIEASIERCLEHSDVFVQLLDEYEWKFPGTNLCLVKVQFEWAKKKLKKEKIFQWISPEKYKENKIQDTERVHSCRFEEFKYLVRNEALHFVKENHKKVSKTRSKLFVRRGKEDSELAKEIFTTLQERYQGEPKISIRYLAEFDSAKEREDYLKKMIKECSILIILYAKSKASWVEDEVDDSFNLQIEVRRDKLPILILKHPADKEEWVLDEDITYVPYNEATDIDILISLISTILNKDNE